MKSVFLYIIVQLISMTVNLNSSQCKVKLYIELSWNSIYHRVWFVLWSLSESHFQSIFIISGSLVYLLFYYYLIEHVCLYLLTVYFKVIKSNMTWLFGLFLGEVCGLWVDNNNDGFHKNSRYMCSTLLTRAHMNTYATLLKPVWDN